MNILYFYNGTNDYECLSLLHGLYQIEWVNIYLSKDMPWLFTDYQGDTKTLYGKGFNTTKLVNPNKKIVHAQNLITKNIENHWYDLIIYGVAYIETPFLELVTLRYKKNEIFFIDGADEDFFLRKNHISLHGLLKKMLPIWYFPLTMIRNAKKCSKLGMYFKREISKKYSGKFIPISFAYPEELFLSEIANTKERLLAQIIPGKLDTYIYEDASSYNKGYQIARFGSTFKKAGWDCWRHYEILANGCIPYFPDINKCPDDTMFLFPKNIIKITNALYEKWEKVGFKEEDEKVYAFYQKLLFDYAKKNLTTKKLAEYVLSYCK